MAGVTFTVDSSGIDRMLALTNPKLFERAIKAGIRQASSTAKTQSAKGIGQKYNLTAARIKQDIGVTMPPGADYALIKFSRRPPTLGQYGAKPGTRATGQPGLGRGRGWGKPTKPGKPLTFAIFRGQRERRPGAFMARGASGNSLIFQRDSQGKLYAQHGPSVGSIFLGNSRHAVQLKADVETAINAAFIKGFQKTLDSAARGYGGR